MTIPVEVGELEAFTPASLKNVPVPPAFLLRPASGRDLRRYQKLIRAEGLVYHDQAVFRAVALEALKALWKPESLYEENAARLRSYWELVEQGGDPDQAEKSAFDELIDRLGRADKRLAGLAADNGEFIEETMRIAASMFVSGWSGLDLAYSREEGRVPLELMDKVEEALFDAEQQAVADKIDGAGPPGLAWMQLCNACQTRLRLTRQEEKNSSPPPPAPPGRSGSRTKRSRKTAASSSKASASSE